MEPRRNFSLEIPLSATSSSFWIVLWENRLSYGRLMEGFLERLDLGSGNLLDK